MEQHQAVKPTINIERKILTGILRIICFMVVFPMIAYLQQWLRQQLSDRHNTNQQINQIIYDFEKDTKTTEDSYMEMTTQLEQKGFDTHHDRR